MSRSDTIDNRPQACIHCLNSSPEKIAFLPFEEKDGSFWLSCFCQQCGGEWWHQIC